MTEIRVETSIPVPPETIWADVADIGSHVEWMHDAESISFNSSTTSGVGTTFDCATRVGPVRLTDTMTITEWEPGAVMGVRHVGIVTGEGRFTLTPEAGGTRFAWTERLAFPWWMGGPVGAWLAAPVLRRIWRRNLKLLRARF